MSETSTIHDTNDMVRHLDCIKGSSTCRAERFVDRDIELIRCLETDTYRHRRLYLGMSVCACPSMKERVL